MRLKKSLTLLTFLVLGGLLVLPATAQLNPGNWQRPFNHVVPPGWQLGQLGWDGEPLSPHALPLDPHRFMAGHMALIPVGPHRGKVLVWNFMRVQIGKQYWSIVDPKAPSFMNFELPVDNQQGDLFCSGHAWTKDGHLLVAGGDRYVGGQLQASDLVYRFDPMAPTGNAMWVREPNLNVPRWYPTVVTQGTDSTGRDQLLVFGGTLDPPPGQAFATYEAFDPTGAPGSGVWDPAGPVFPGPAVQCPDQFWIYPREVLLPSGKVFTAGVTELGYRVQHDTTVGPPSWEVQTVNPMLWRLYGSTVLFPNEGGSASPFKDVVMKVGGTAVFWNYQTCQPIAGTPIATNTVEVVSADLPATHPSWVWQFGPNMFNVRARQDATLLPDATVFVNGGKLDTANDFVTALPVTEAEIFNEVFGTWRRVAKATVRRGYHSTAALLPDGRVLVGGGEQREMDYELYEPPYLRNGTVRPVLVNPPSTLTMNYGQSYGLQYQTLPPGVKVERVVLMAPASITHHSDMHQRYVELDPCDADPCVVSPDIPPGVSVASFTAPPSSTHAPRGYYMLFLVTNPQGSHPRGTPSVATWVRLQ